MTEGIQDVESGVSWQVGTTETEKTAFWHRVLSRRRRCYGAMTVQKRCAIVENV